MKKIAIAGMILVMWAAGANAGNVREIKRIRHETITKTIINYETKTIPVKTLDVAGVTISVVGNTITLKSNTFTLTIKKTVKPGIVQPVQIIP